MDISLPKYGEGYRWYLAKHSAKYACLKLQKQGALGRWTTVADELCCITGRQFPVEIAIRDAAEDIISIMDAPHVPYGVIS